MPQPSSTSRPSYRELNAALIPLAIEAGNIILEYFHSGFEVTTKADDSPVTEADEAAEAIILKGLADNWPSITVVAEEMCASGIVPPPSDLFFLVDPLDGTKEFISKRDEFTVNIGLIENGVPVYGIIFAPALGELYVSLAPDRAGMACLKAPFDPAYIAQQLKSNSFALREISVRPGGSTGGKAVVSRSHIDDKTLLFLDKNSASERVPSGSSLKFCLLARGDADIYPRFSPTMEWDTAAGHGILLCAGGVLVAPDGTPFLYGKYEAGYLNGGFIACAPDKLEKIHFL